MPIAASFSSLNSQIEQALSMGQGAQISVVATQFASAVSGAVPSGQWPPPFYPPLAPSGFSASQSLFEQALSMDVAANPATTAQLFAQAVSVMAPIVPPSGLATLATQIEQAFNMGPAAQEPLVAIIITQAIITYFLSGGVL